MGVVRVDEICGLTQSAPGEGFAVRPQDAVVDAALAESRGKREHLVLPAALPFSEVDVDDAHGGDYRSFAAMPAAMALPWKRPFSIKISLVWTPATITPAR
jgi:hypothetical protein